MASETLSNPNSVTNYLLGKFISIYWIHLTLDTDSDLDYSSICFDSLQLHPFPQLLTKVAERDVAKVAERDVAKVLSTVFFSFSI